jgi:hypothetical protein
LALPLIASVEYEEGYDWGLFCRGERIDYLDREAHIFEKHWMRSDPGKELARQVQEELAALRNAIALAREKNGLLVMVGWE